MGSEWLVLVLVCVIMLMGIGDLIFMAWREVEHKRQIDILTSKIMSKDYAQYASYKPEENRKIEKPDNGTARPKRPADPVLGTQW